MTLCKNIQLFFLLLTGTLFTILVSCGNNETAQDNNTKDTLRNEEIPVQLTYQMPAEMHYVDKTDDILVDAFYPVGWSKDGYFAYITEPADEATGFYFFTFQIIDGNTGKPEWSWRIDEKNEQTDGTALETWKTNKHLFESTLEHYKIIQQQNLKIEKFPLVYNNKTYRADLIIKKNEDEFGYGFKVVGDCHLFLETQGGQPHEIFYNNYQNNMILAIENCGYLKNPYGTHILALLKTIRMGYEGPPNVVSFHPAFTDLNKI